MANEKDDKQGHSQKITFYFGLIRGILIIILGLFLIFNRDKSRSMLVNAMGLFWLTTGIALFRHDVHHVGRRLSKVVAGVAIVTGLVVISRGISKSWIGEEVFFVMAGAVVLITGVLHIVAEYRIGASQSRKLTGAHTFLGIFEIALGTMLVMSPLERGPIIYWTLTLWALLGGAIVIATVIVARRRENRKNT